jgi:hypothetical protein
MGVVVVAIAGVPTVGCREPIAADEQDCSVGLHAPVNGRATIAAATSERCAAGIAELLDAGETRWLVGTRVSLGVVDRGSMVCDPSAVLAVTGVPREA